MNDMITDVYLNHHYGSSAKGGSDSQESITHTRGKSTEVWLEWNENT